MVRYLSHIAPLADNQSLILSPSLSFPHTHTNTHAHINTPVTLLILCTYSVLAHARRPVLMPMCYNMSVCAYACVFDIVCIRQNNGESETPSSPAPPGKEQFSKNVAERPNRKSLLSHLRWPTKL